MWSNFYFLVTIYFLLRAISGAPIKAISYIEDLKVSYENGQWICFDVECPKNTFGCRFQRKTDADDRKMLNMIYTCFDEQKESLLAAADTIQMAKERIIDIDVETYVGADTVFSAGYGLGDHEDAHGTIAFNEWNAFKRSAKTNKDTIEESNAQFE